MVNDRFLKEAQGDEAKAFELRSAFKKLVAPPGAHFDCLHDHTKAARQACRRRAAREAKAHAEQG